MSKIFKESRFNKSNTHVKIPLPKQLAACNNFEQDNLMCKACIRNISFYNLNQTIWDKFVIFEYECSGYISCEEYREKYRNNNLYK